MQFDLKKSIETLQKTPQVLPSLVSNVHPNYTTCNEGEGTWGVLMSFDIYPKLRIKDFKRKHIKTPNAVEVPLSFLLSFSGISYLYTFENKHLSQRF